MDLKTVGIFISSCRKEKKLTQEQLASKLNISDRAISKWERGLSLPDASIMIELCEILEISVNELLSGERIEKESYNKKAEKLLVEMTNLKEESDKKMLSLEIVIGFLGMFILLSLTFIAAFIEMDDWIRVVLIVTGFVVCLIAVYFGLKIEQEAGYYECNKCHHKYVPTFNSVLWAMHVNRTRYMKCPKCAKWSWNKKVLKK